MNILIVLAEMMKAIAGSLIQSWTRAGIRIRNRGARIDPGVVVMGRKGCVTLGEKTTIEGGVVLDLRRGGRIDLGAGTTVRRGAILSPWGGVISMGHDCVINHYSVIYGHGGFWAGNHVMVAAHGVIIPANHGTASVSVPMHLQPLTKSGIRLGNDIWIGAGATILDGVQVCDGAVIAAGAVVNKDVSPGAIMGGVPARELRNRFGDSAFEKKNG